MISNDKNIVISNDNIMTSNDKNIMINNNDNIMISNDNNPQDRICDKNFTMPQTPRINIQNQSSRTEYEFPSGETVGRGWQG